MTFPEYGMGAECNNQFVDLYTAPNLLDMTSSTYNVFKLVKFYVRVE